MSLDLSYEDLTEIPQSVLDNLAIEKFPENTELQELVATVKKMM